MSESNPKALRVTEQGSTKSCESEWLPCSWHAISMYSYAIGKWTSIGYGHCRCFLDIRWLCFSIFDSLRRRRESDHSSMRYWNDSRLQELVGSSVSPFHPPRQINPSFTFHLSTASCSLTDRFANSGRIERTLNCLSPMTWFLTVFTLCLYISHVASFATQITNYIYHICSLYGFSIPIISARQRSSASPQISTAFDREQAI
jgi:hypothetical protein